MAKYKKLLGIDIGGTGIKGAIVDMKTGDFLTERYRLDTPQPATPKAVADTVKKVLDHFEWKEGPVGCGFPSIIKDGVALIATNIEKGWVNTNVPKLLKKECPKNDFYVLNDADAAGIASMKFGSGKDFPKGVVIMITLGTGIGSAVFTDGKLVPNTELGWLNINNNIAEKIASKAAQKREGISMEVWGKRLNDYFQHLERLFTPVAIIAGGGGAKKIEEFTPYLKLNTNFLQAKLKNNAGIVGAALYAQNSITEQQTSKKNRKKKK